MMRILFCNIAWMKEYRGNEDGKDTPLNGGSYVDETGDAHEKYNFTPVNMEGKEGLYCLGFFETKSHNGKDVNQMRIENIAGCELLKKEESVDDVLVVYCAKHPAHKFTTVVGWYKHATVFRHYQEAVFAPEDIQYYNAIANSSDCVLLPAGIRSRKVQWEVPRKSNGWAYGFGRANVWYASEEDMGLDTSVVVIRTLIDKEFSCNRVSELIGTGEPYIYGETHIYPVAHPGYWGTRTRGEDNVIADWMRIRK